MNALESAILTLSAVPDLCPEARSLILAAFGTQSGLSTLPEVVDYLQEPGLRRFNLPTEEGRLAGAELARLVGDCPGQCDTCGFKLGTIPNQCAHTVATAMECAITGEVFECHQNGQPCRGWLKTQSDSNAA